MLVMAALTAKRMPAWVSRSPGKWQIVFTKRAIQIDCAARMADRYTALLARKADGRNPANFSFSKIARWPAISRAELFEPMSVRRMTWNITSPETRPPTLTACFEKETSSTSCSTAFAAGGPM